MSSSAATLQPPLTPRYPVNRDFSGQWNPAVTNQGERKRVIRLSNELAIELCFEATETEPAWLFHWMRRVSDLLNLPEDWDSYGSRGITADAVLGAIQLLLPVFGSMDRQPLTFPHRSGGIQLEWHIGESDLEVLAFSEHQFRVSYTRDGQEVFDDQMVRDPELVVNALRELAIAS